MLSKLAFRRVRRGQRTSEKKESLQTAESCNITHRVKRDCHMYDRAACRSRVGLYVLSKQGVYNLTNSKIDSWLILHWLSRQKDNKTNDKAKWLWRDQKRKSKQKKSNLTTLWGSKITFYSRVVGGDNYSCFHNMNITLQWVWSLLSPSNL